MIAFHCQGEIFKLSIKGPEIWHPARTQYITPEAVSFYNRNVIAPPSVVSDQSNEKKNIQTVQHHHSYSRAAATAITYLPCTCQQVHPGCDSYTCMKRLMHLCASVWLGLKMNCIVSYDQSDIGTCETKKTALRCVEG